MFSPSVRAFALYNIRIMKDRPKRTPRRKSKLQQIKHFLIPHAGNRYKPGIFAVQSVAAIALIIVLIEGAYQFQINVVNIKTGFTAAVLPAALLDLTNSDRTANDLRQLIENPLLNEAAQDAANDMAAKGYFAHVSPDGKTPWDWITQVGYNYTYAGENLAVDFTDSNDVEAAWMASPEHHANIVDSNYTQIGYGVAQGTYQGHDATFVVEMFAAPRTVQTVAAPAPVAAAPASNLANVPADVLATTAAPAVLAAATHATAAPVGTTQNTGNALAVLATSPRRIVFYLVGTLMAFIAILFAVSLFFHVRKRYVYFEIIIDGAALLVLGYGVLFFNGSAASVNLPQSNEGASVSLALPHALQSSN